MIEAQLPLPVVDIDIEVEWGDWIERNYVDPADRLEELEGWAS